MVNREFGLNTDAFLGPDLWSWTLIDLDVGLGELVVENTALPMPCSLVIVLEPSPNQ